LIQDRKTSSLVKGEVPWTGILQVASHPFNVSPACQMLKQGCSNAHPLVVWVNAQVFQIKMGFFRMVFFHFFEPP